MAPKHGKFIPSLPNIVPETMYHSKLRWLQKRYRRSWVAIILAFFASCDSTLRTYFLVIGLVMRKPVQASAFQSQMLKRRNGLRLWSDMWKWPSGLMCILIHHHGNRHIIYRCVCVLVWVSACECMCILCLCLCALRWILSYFCTCAQGPKKAHRHGWKYPFILLCIVIRHAWHSDMTVFM